MLDCSGFRLISHMLAWTRASPNLDSPARRQMLSSTFRINVKSSVMWSCLPGSVQIGDWKANHSTFFRASEGLEPFQNRAVFAPRCREPAGHGFNASDRLAFHIEIHFGVPVRSIVQSRQSSNVNAVGNFLSPKGNSLFHTRILLTHLRGVFKRYGSLYPPGRIVCPYGDPLFPSGEILRR